MGPTIPIPSGAAPPYRPSADLLLATLAVTCGARAIAVVLSGCAALQSKPRAAAPVRINADPYPSTYARYPGAVTVIRGSAR